MNKQRIKQILSILFLISTLNGCAVILWGYNIYTDSRGPSVVMADQGIDTSLKSSLLVNCPGCSFTVASYDYHVLVAGQVSTAEEEKQALDIVRANKKVKGIYNYIKIEPNVGAIDISKDLLITTEADTLFKAKKGIKTNNIKIVTDNGVVYVLGKRAGSPVVVHEVVNEIRTVSGVKDVVNLVRYF